MELYHMHHIIPRYMGGTDSKDNLIKLTVEEHAEAHRKLWEEHGNKEDWLAWKGLAGIMTKKEIVKEHLLLAGLKGNRIRNERYHSDPEWAAEIRRKQSKPKSTTENYFKPKTKEHAENIRKAALARPRIECPKCGKGYTKANYNKHVNACKGK